MNTIFDKHIDRKNTRCVKYDGLKRVYKEGGLFPLWVADMDFACAAPIVEDLKKRVEHCIFGYEELGEEFFGAIVHWYQKRHSVDLEAHNIAHVAGVVSGLSIAIEAFSSEGDEVIIQPPVYHPFFGVVKHLEREIVLNPLKKDGSRYVMDIENLKNIITKKTKIVILCSPHNPVGRVWSKSELEELVEVCKEHKILIVSDEIHSDLVFERFTPLCTLEDNILTINSPSKSFNLAGLNTAYAFSKNPKIIKSYKKMLAKRSLEGSNNFGTTALISAYSKCEFWLEELLKYIEGNFDMVLESLKSTNIKTYKPEGTYLMWLDFKETNLSHVEIEDILQKDLKLALNSGLSFGKDGEYFFRLNIALPRNILREKIELISSRF